MKAKKYLLGIFLFLFAPSFAQQVSLETAQCVADIFLRNNMSAAMRSASATHITTSSASVIKPIGKVAQSPVMYAVSQDSVWVLISADERVTPILAYSDANAGTFPEYNDMPEGMIALLDWYEEQIQYLRDSTNITTIHEGWRTYQAASNTAKTEIIVPPLLQRNGERILWKQSGLNQGASSSDKCYNKFCPLTSEGKRSIVGCVAVAMGQVMWYWQWPKIAFVKDDNQRTLIREYNWDYMPARLQNSTPIEHIDMVANLLHDAGVSVNMTYTDSLSGAYSAVIPDALRSVFGYNADAIKYRTSNNTVWLNLLKDNLQKGYPVLYSGYRIKDKGGKDGHQFVLDGYNSDDAFHINYGWGGSQNGYYILETIANKPFVYYSSQSAILNVYPNYPDCSPREVLSKELQNTKFIVQHGGGLTISNKTIENNQEGVIYSGEYVKLTNGFHAKAGCNLRIAIKDMQCGESQSASLVQQKSVSKNMVGEWCNQWNTLSHSYFGAFDPLSGAVTYKYVLGKDILINDKTYVELMCYSTNDVADLGTYICALRFAENRKVYIYYDNTEYLLYDFDVHVGDTLELFAGIKHYKHQNTYTHVVTDIDTLENGRVQVSLDAILSTKRNNNIHEERFPKIWIEGLGSMDGIVHNNATVLEGSGISVLLCAYHNDECRYTTDNPKYISLGCIYNEGDMINSVETVTTPNSSAQKIMHNGQLFILLNGKTYNVMGVEVEK